ncbi:putative integral membrane protein [Actinoplanes missouriensis 431]|uniref:Putative integral membrane protein n=1 Tax=Actinoplanes missouriensis (strain ATCC 14538 / DSM 43046 / CBS 188.64 / JCM 3121 / NBRC 102363 / NCIMB 12654 / NRRL B-3342 / UNCC 431) TaxID=512565 RepID=I0H6E0_ACTM4|nr:DMT family transporter [Actinoplanes missouriensis]BAL88577.1 putative integral membrane protein [Actinoplanes missouriensis 431]
MRAESSATEEKTVTAGLLLGALGVLAFSLSLPFTRVAVADLDPWFVAFGRAVGAAALAWGYLRFTGAVTPTPRQWRRLVVVALGVVVGFPLFTSLALTTSTSAHGAVVITVLPAMTAVFAVLRAGERPPLLFWLASVGGLAVVLTFLIASGTVHGALSAADLFLLAAVILCGLGYAEGGALSRELGGARTICWALIVALPVTVPVTVTAALAAPPHAGLAGWAAFGYLTVISMFLGFFAWYAGLARGGIAKVGQIQLVQPLLTLGWSALLLGEAVSPGSLAAAIVVLGCVVATQRARTRPQQSERHAQEERHAQAERHAQEERHAPNQRSVQTERNTQNERHAQDGRGRRDAPDQREEGDDLLTPAVTPSGRGTPRR